MKKIEKYNFVPRSKIVSLLRRLSPRLPRPGGKTSCGTGGGSVISSPTVCPWVRVEYSNETLNNARRDESQESDVSFQRELQLNELRKRMVSGGTSPSLRLPTSSSAHQVNRLLPDTYISTVQQDTRSSATVSPFLLFIANRCGESLTRK